MKIHVPMITLFRAANELGKARQSGDSDRIREAEQKLKGLEAIALSEHTIIQADLRRPPNATPNEL